MMNNDFPRILTLLRKERGMSQKKVAADLGISQALLSHYEKGIRECGLDFLVRAAAYYNVSCDYLLGCTPHRNGVGANLPQEENPPSQDQPVSPVEDQRRMLVNSINIVFGILQKINSEGLTRHMSAFLSCAVYKMFRLLYSAYKKNPQETFSLGPGLYDAQLDAHMALSQGKARFLLDGNGLENAPGVGQSALPVLNPTKLSTEYPLYAPSLFELVQNTEQAVLEKNNP